MAGMTEYSFRNEWMLAITTEFTVRFQCSTSASLRWMLSECMLSLPQVIKCNAAIWFLFRELLYAVIGNDSDIPSFGFITNPSCSVILAVLPLINYQNMIPLIHVCLSPFHHAESRKTLLVAKITPSFLPLFLRKSMTF